MYSLTLLVALSASAAQPSTFFGGACAGACNGAVACHGAAACHGGLFSRHHARLACLGAAACNGAAYCNGASARHGGFLSRWRHRHAACVGAVCVGAHPHHHPMPAEPAKPEKPEKIPVKPAEKKADLGKSAQLLVLVPEDAKLYIDGQPTQQTGSRRSFITPELTSSRSFFYTLTVELPNGERWERQVTFRPGELVEVDLMTYSIAR
ncbi:MAG: TIGR03000 domain-containing protein [Gemmatales bacterium]|nr:TIGR03000 domain-containing protein [Gemmatales bacterium]MDW7993578.1 TIGR03000 domain-containing protein [Gemmatales bacterium]